MTKILTGLNVIADRYDGIFLDIWGVIHNGIELFPHVIPTLNELKLLDKRVVLVSNSPRRAHLVAEELKGRGLSRSLYTDIITSGEATYIDLDNALKKHGSKCYFMGGSAHRGIFDDFENIEIVTDIQEADFILNTGASDIEETIDQIKPILLTAFDKKILMICANPDQKVMIGSKPVLCAGYVANLYEQLGGDVHYHGKPYRFVYELATQKFGRQIDPARLIGIGDSLHNDVLGAQNFGIDSALIMSGIHGPEIGIKPGDVPLPKDLKALKLAHNIEATYALPTFKF